LPLADWPAWLLLAAALAPAAALTAPALPLMAAAGAELGVDLGMLEGMAVGADAMPEGVLAGMATSVFAGLARPAAPPDPPATLGITSSMGAPGFAQPMLDTESASATHSAEEDQMEGVGMRAPSNAACRNSSVIVRHLCGTERGLWANTQPRR
jgi:hypothetical protein